MGFRITVAALAALALSSCAGIAGGDRYARLLPPNANPTEVIATELAFARAAKEDGQWTAFREFSTDEAVMFVPEAVNAHDWLAKQTDPPQTVAWQPHQMWSSCDGSLAVTSGAWQRPDGTAGYFTTVWQRQRNGKYRWVLDQGDALDEPLKSPEFVSTDVALCDPLAPIAQSADPAGGTTYRFTSDDRTLGADVRLDPWCGRIVTVNIFRGSETDTDPPGMKRGTEIVLSRQVSPPNPADGTSPPQACAAG